MREVARGASFFAEHVERSIDQSRAFAELVGASDDFELAVEPECNIVCFRLSAPEGRSDALQLSLRETVNRRGRFFIMRVELRGAVWLRVVLMNSATRLADLRELLDELSRLADEPEPAS